MGMNVMGVHHIRLNNSGVDVVSVNFVCFNDRRVYIAPATLPLSLNPTNDPDADIIGMDVVGIDYSSAYEIRMNVVRTKHRRPRLSGLGLTAAQDHAKDDDAEQHRPFLIGGFVHIFSPVSSNREIQANVNAWS
jgi:hypothetical protein